MGMGATPWLRRGDAGAALARRATLAVAVMFLSLVLLGAGVGAAAEAPERAVSNQAEARLLTDRDVAAPGGVVTAALQLTLAPGWHSYWRNPGASGLETRLVWEAPEGVEIGPLQFPAPTRIPFGNLVNFGFDGEAIHLAEITLPSDWPVGAPLALSAQADWLVCDDICLPESQRFTLTLPVGERAETDFAAALVVARGRASQPARSEEPARHRRLEDGRLLIEIDGPAMASPQLRDHFFFPVDWRAAQPSAPQQVERREGGLAITITPADAGFASPVEGVLRAVNEAGAPIAIHLAAEDAGEGGAPVIAAAPGAAGPAEGSTSSGGGAAPAGDGALADAGDPAGEGSMGALGENRALGGLTDASGAAASLGGAARTPASLGLGLSPSVGAALLLAFLGGLILNLMPCVFPVLALKAMAIANSAHRAKGAADLSHGFAYGAGVMISFLGFAGLLLALREAGVAAGWGFQLQTPIVVAALAYVLVLVGLNLSGVFEISTRLSSAGQSLTESDGTAGSFFTGVLAAVVAAPCTAPFMGAALGYAVTQDAVVALAVFAALGLGFAAPMVALAAAPSVARRVPKPGPWMVRFRQALAFPMYLTAAWLFWVLGNQAGVDALFAALCGAVLLGFAAWALGAGYPLSRPGRVAAVSAAGLALLGAAWALSPSLAGAPTPSAARAASSAAGQTALGEPYAATRLAQLRAEGRPVFLNVTADWCISCKVNELNVLSGARFEATLEAHETVYLKGDWTLRDEAVTALLAGFGRVGVPLYVVYPANGGAPEVLPQILTHDIVEAALAAAAAERPAARGAGRAALTEPRPAG